MSAERKSMSPRVAVLLAAGAVLAGCGGGEVREGTLAGVYSFGEAGRGPGQFDQPQSVACAPDGSVYVVDRGNARVQRFSAEGKFLAEFGTRGDPALPPGCGASPAQILKAWEAKGPGFGRFVAPFGVVVDKAGNPWVVDGPSNLVTKFDEHGTFLFHFMVEAYVPGDLALDPKGNLLVTNAGGANLLRYEPDGKKMAALGSYGPLVGQFVDPNSCIVSDEGNLYVADTGNRRIQILSSDGGYLADWTAPAGVTCQLRRMAFHPSGDLYVTDEGGKCVWVLDRRLRPKWRLKSVTVGGAPVPLVRPFALAIARDGGVYVSDLAKSAVYRCRPL